MVLGSSGTVRQLEAALVSAEIVPSGSRKLRNWEDGLVGKVLTVQA